VGPDGKIQVVEDLRYQSHRSADRHPERPERLVAVGQALAHFEHAIERMSPRPAEPDEILRIHSRDLLARVEEAARLAPGRLDPDTYVCRESFDVARLAAGGTVDLARSIARGDAQCGLAAVRPPGHHAETDRAMGFCLFNNVAIAARALQAEGFDKLMILDWDVHHGNGTQHSFEDDPSVLYISTHQFPYYPGTGDAGEAGSGRGAGATVNVPMPAGCGDHEYVGVMRRIVAPVARQFRPEMILVSCGFDAHRDDPLASMEVSEAGFREMTAIIRGLANELCDSRLLFVLEGGYAVSGLIEGTRALLTGLTTQASEKHREIEPVMAAGRLSGILDRVAAVHGSRYPGLHTT
jgi:acetoin utilization deacetylase AcuC-like enzyme